MCSYGRRHFNRTYPTVPVTVEYCLTPLGMTLLETVNSLVRWTVEHELEIAGTRATYDARSQAPIALRSRDRTGVMPLEPAGRMSG